jgi:hypothetical protein
MTSTAVRRRAQVEAPARELHLINWPLRDDAILAWLVIGAAAAISVAISAVTSTAAGLAAFLALALAMWRLWVPVRFDLGPDGVTQTAFGRRRHVSWRKIAEYSVTRRGVMLHAYPEELRPMAPRSLYVRGGRQLDQLLDLVAHYVGGSVGRGSASSLHRAARGSTGSSARAAANDTSSKRTSSDRSTPDRDAANREESTETPASPESPAMP